MSFRERVHKILLEMIVGPDGKINLASPPKPLEATEQILQAAEEELVPEKSDLEHNRQVGSWEQGYNEAIDEIKERIREP